MKVMVIVKATGTSESGAPPRVEDMAAMGKFNEELIKAGILLEADGLQPSKKGKRVFIRDSGEKRVVDGPFTESKELVAGFWIWQVKSMDEAVEWARRCPNPMPGDEGVLEIRPIYGPEDFAPSDPVAERLLKKEEVLRQQVEARRR